MLKKPQKAFNLCETCAHEEYQKLQLIEYCDSFKPKKFERNQRKLFVLTQAKIYNSATEARDDLGICISSISSVCTGRYKSAGRNLKEKYVFKYYDDYIKMTHE